MEGKMSTRSVIAEPYGDGWRGRYHHFDGYPSGVGATLWDLFHGYYLEDLDAMTHRLITDEPVGWSNINGADMNLPNCWTDRNTETCAICGRQTWEHYRQYYGSGYGEGRTAPNPHEIVQFGHSPKPIEGPHGPESYSARGESDEQWITSDGDDGGTEWAYVLAKRGLWIFERRFGGFGDDQGHGTGMWGMGASDTEAGGHWFCVGLFEWGEAEPNWEQLDQGADVAA